MSFRTRLFVFYSATLDPLGVSERWGYWKNSEAARPSPLHWLGTRSVGGEDWQSRLQDFQGSPITEPDRQPRPSTGHRPRS